MAMGAARSDPYRSIATLRAGGLEEVPLGLLLFALAVRERTCVLVMQRGDLKKAIILEDGVPIACASNLVQETLGRFLVARGDLTLQQSQECLAEATERRMQFGGVLLEKKLIDATHLDRSLRQSLARKLLECFTWPSGEFRILSEVPAVPYPVAVNVPQLVFTGITRFSPQAQVHAGIGHLVGSRLAMRSRPPVPLSKISLSREQRRVIAMISRNLQLGQLFDAACVSSDELGRLLYALSTLGAIVPVPETGLPRPADGAARPQDAAPPLAFESFPAAASPGDEPRSPDLRAPREEDPDDALELVLERLWLPDSAASAREPEDSGARDQPAGGPDDPAGLAEDADESAERAASVCTHAATLVLPTAVASSPLHNSAVATPRRRASGVTITSGRTSSRLASRGISMVRAPTA